VKLDFDAKILNLKNEPLKESDDDMTLGSVICSVMLNVIPEDQNGTGQKKMQMFRMAQLASQGGEADVKAEDIVLLKDRVAKMCGALIVGRVYDLLDGS
jgi:hypothetical protein